MARLNEPNMPVDSHLEILRRKFLRQNRDIAKINSDQSQKIRRLENDCARLLSENLDLRGQVLRLEKQIEDNAARRIADHALGVKAKLEVQLSEFAALLGSLGVEPPPKRRLSEGHTLAKPWKSTIRSPPPRRRRDTAGADALAEQEGRLPPIYENKTYPRATMNSDEILALCAAAADTSDSPDLGPPPVSRYIEEHAARHVLPTTAVETDVPESPKPPHTFSSPPKPDFDRRPSASPGPSNEAEEVAIRQATPVKDAVPATQSASKHASQPIRAGSKRKYGDENGTVQNVTTQTGKENVINGLEKVFPTRGGQKRRSIKDAPGSRRERTGGTRTPLTAKSTNGDVSSPQKMMEAAPLMESMKEQVRDTNPLTAKGELSATKPLLRVEILPPEPPAVDTVMLESVSALPSAAPSSPTTPDRPVRNDIPPHDTPPPAEISSTGETSRPSRRARAAISYAEPNLRDKMRRPTKELFDAVAGEGKFVHRATAGPGPDDHHSAPTSSSKVRLESGSSTGRSSKAVSTGDPTPTARHHTIVSPLAQKDVFPGALPSTVVTERRKRSSAAGSSRESLAAAEKVESVSGDPTQSSIAARAQAAAQTGSSTSKIAPSTTTKATGDGRQQQSSTPPAEIDIYDFAPSSPTAPALTPKESSPPETATSTEVRPAAVHCAHSHSQLQTSSRPRPTRKSSMAAAVALRELLDEEQQHEAQPTTATTSSSTKARSSHHTRKRASMLAPKKSSMLLAGGDSLEDAADADTSGSSMDGEGGSGAKGSRERISRRRSMML